MINELLSFYDVNFPVGHVAYRLGLQLKLLVDIPKEITVEAIPDPAVQFGIRARLSFGSCDSPALRQALRFIRTGNQFRHTAALHVRIHFPGCEPPPDWDGKPYDIELSCADKAEVEQVCFEAEWLLGTLHVFRQLFGRPAFNGRVEDYFKMPGMRNTGRGR